jgi:hypothetical protein
MYGINTTKAWQKQEKIKCEVQMGLVQNLSKKDGRRALIKRSLFYKADLSVKILWVP